MPRLRYTGGSRYALRDGPTWTEGDVHDVDGSTADRLADLEKFELVETGDETEPEPESESEPEPFDPDLWLEQDYQRRADRVEAGDVDENLGTIADIETSKTVKSAVDKRQEAIE